MATGLDRGFIKFILGTAPPQWLYIPLNGTPDIDCFWVGAVPKVYCQ